MQQGRNLFLALCLTVLVTGCYSLDTKLSSKSPYYPLERLQEGSILHIPTGTMVTEGQLFSYLYGSRVVYVGEAHDNLEHHRVQLRVIKALEEQYPGSVSVGMEMFRNSSQPMLDRWVAGEVDEREFYKEWVKNWGIDYDYYRDILEYVRERRIPLIALNASREQIIALNHRGVEGEGELNSATLPEMDPNDPYHRAMVEAVYYDPSHNSHGHGKGDFDRFYRMLLLWEETMAETIARHLTEGGKERRMVVLSGGGHINYGYGIPKRVFRRLSLPYTTILPISPTITGDKKLAKEKGVKLLDVELPSAPLHLADFVWATGYERVENTRPRLGVQLHKKEGRVEIVAVVPGSAADRGGVRKGDAIESFDGESVTDVSDVQYLVGLKEFGDEAVMGIVRNDESSTITVRFEAPVNEGDDSGGHDSPSH
ncbi:MAG: ChaN family lipoprotein [Thermodesulfobacteriota bacterium]